MGKFALLLCAASTAFATLVFVLPQALQSGTPAAPAQAAKRLAPQVPAIVDVFQAEKPATRRSPVPAQF